LPTLTGPRDVIEDRKANYLFFRRLAFFAFFAFAFLFFAICCPPSHDIVAMSDQCSRESTCTAIGLHQRDGKNTDSALSSAHAPAKSDVAECQEIDGLILHRNICCDTTRSIRHFFYVAKTPIPRAFLSMSDMRACPRNSAEQNAREESEAVQISDVHSL
jgi:hypothetical protein